MINLPSNFSRIAPYYDTYSHLQRYMADKLVRELKGRAFNLILEVGCGTGYYTALLSRDFPEAKIVSFDISKSMLDIAQKRLAQKRVSLFAADAENIYFSMKCDLITSNACFQWLHDFERFIMVFGSYLAEGGIMSFSTFGPETLWEVASIIKEVMGDDLPLPAHSFIDKKRILSILAERGFNRVCFQEEIKEEIYPTAIELLRTIKYSSGGGSVSPKKIVFTKRILHSMEEAYIKRFNHIKATYQTFYCTAKK
ncbi:MAG: methyltransferase domain-containing protein [bacterium]